MGATHGKNVGDKEGIRHLTTFGHLVAAKLQSAPAGRLPIRYLRYATEQHVYNNPLQQLD